MRPRLPEQKEFEFPTKCGRAQVPDPRHNRWILCDVDSIPPDSWQTMGDKARQEIECYRQAREECGREVPERLEVLGDHFKSQEDAAEAMLRSYVGFESDDPFEVLNDLKRCSPMMMLSSLGPEWCVILTQYWHRVSPKVRRAAFEKLAERYRRLAQREGGNHGK